MIGCLWTHVSKQPITMFYFEFETVLKFYNLEARPGGDKTFLVLNSAEHGISKAQKI